MKKKILLISLVSLISGCYGISSVKNMDKTENKDFQAKSLENIKNKEITSEIEKLKKYLVTNKTDTQTYEKISELYLQLNDTEHATMYFAKGSMNTKNKIDTLSINKTIKNLETKMSSEKLTEKEYKELINSFISKKEYKKSELISLQAIKYYPKSSGFYNTLGVLYSAGTDKESLEIRDNNKSVEMYKKAIEFASTDENKGSYHRNLAFTYERLLDDKTAITEFELAHKLSPNYLGIQEEIARLYQKQNDNQKAIEAYKNTQEYKLGIEPDFSELKDKIKKLEVSSDTSLSKIIIEDVKYNFSNKK